MEQEKHPKPSAQQMVNALESLLPAGKKSNQRGHGVDIKSSAPPSAELIYNYHGRTAKIRVALYRSISSNDAVCPDRAYHPEVQCAITELSQGGRLLVIRSPEDEQHPSGPTILTSVVSYKSGKQIMVSQGDSHIRPTASGGNPSFPLTSTQLSAIAASSIWKPILDEVPRPPDDHRVAPVMTGPEIASTLTSLLPSNLPASEAGGSDEYGHVVVDDSHGKSLIAVNVQKWDPHDAPMREVFKKSHTLPDGTRIRVEKVPAQGGGKGAVEWSVDTLRKDGFRVLIMAVNAPAYKLPATRSKPPLDISQLKKIALDKKWRLASS
ncbi:hypothetical protein [Streptomyces sp. NPDC095817]|uniref:hypothetical protein n=1 Tax=Streptomyces sp. NPDC095817 TaxID=3155082 RepID=UPI00331B4A08